MCLHTYVSTQMKHIIVLRWQKIMSVKHINTQLCYDFSKTKIIQKFKTADQWALSFMKMGYNALLKKRSTGMIRYQYKLIFIKSADH